MGTIADKLQKLLNSKEAIKTAIEEKGQTVPDTAPLSAYADKIRAIQTGMTQEEADKKYLQVTGGQATGTYTFQKDGPAHRVVINGEYSPDGSVAFPGGSSVLNLYVDENIEGGVYLTAGMPNSGDSPARLGNVQAPVNALDAANKQYVDKIIPSGIVVMWSGTVNNIPTGWALCDGQDGRPDLRGLFVLGAGGAYNPGDTGGAEEVTLTVAQLPAHRFSYSYRANGKSNTVSSNGSSYNLMQQDTEGASITTKYTKYLGNSAPHPNMPPYYVLAYIMKL